MVEGKGAIQIPTNDHFNPAAGALLTLLNFTATNTVMVHVLGRKLPDNHLARVSAS